MTDFVPASGSDFATPRRTGKEHVEQVEETLADLRALDYRRGGGASREAVLLLLDQTQQLIAAATPGPLVDRLGLALADLQNLAGWASFDIGLADAALGHFDAALDLASDLEHHDLMANICYRTGRVHLHHDTPDQALEDFEQGRHHALRAQSPLALAILSANQAWACAKQGDDNQALSLLSRAIDEFGQADIKEAPPWAAFFDATDLTAMIGTVHTELAQTVDAKYAGHAVPALLDAIRGYGDGMARSRSFNAIALAIDHLIEGDTDEGIIAGERALELSEGVASSRIKDRIKPLLDRLGRFGERADARELAFRISNFAEPRA